MNVKVLLVRVSVLGTPGELVESKNESPVSGAEFADSVLVPDVDTGVAAVTM